MNSSTGSLSISSNNQTTTPNNNTIIYIKDPKNKNGDIQHVRQDSLKTENFRI